VIDQQPIKATKYRM